MNKSQKRACKLILLINLILVPKTQGESLAERVQIIKRLGDIHDNAVLPMAMTYIKGEFVLFISTNHLYRGLKSDVVASASKVVINLDPRKLYNLGGYPKFVADMGHYNTTQVILFKYTEKSSPRHCLGIVREARNKEMIVYSLGNFSAPVKTIAAHGMFICPVYWPMMDDPIYFAYLTQNHFSYWTRKSAAIETQVSTIQTRDFLVVELEAAFKTMFVFMYSGERALFFNRYTQRFSYDSFDRLLELDKVMADGTHGRLVLEKDHHNILHQSYYSKFASKQYTGGKIEENSVFYAQTVHGEDLLPIADLDRRRTTETPFVMSDLKQPENYTLYSLSCLILFFVVLTIIGLHILLKNRRKVEETIQKHSIKIGFDKGNVFAMDHSTMSTNFVKCQDGKVDWKVPDSSNAKAGSISTGDDSRAITKVVDSKGGPVSKGADTEPVMKVAESRAAQILKDSKTFKDYKPTLVKTLKTIK